MCRLRNKVLLYINTVRYLKCTQVWHQILKRLPGGEKKLRSRVMRLPQGKRVVPVSVLVPALDLNEAYLARYQVEGLLQNEIGLLHEKHLLNLAQWEAEEASHLWNYNLHYMEFLIPLAVASVGGRTTSCTDKNDITDRCSNRKDKADSCFAKWCEYVRMWIRHPAGDSFEPYTISMRIPNLLICTDILQEKLRGTALERELMDSIYRQYQYLLAAQELALLANHYFEDLKTIVLCSILFDEKDTYRKYFAKFCGQIREQVLADGLHFERSIMYQKIILEDILRVYVTLSRRAEAMASHCPGSAGPDYGRDAGKLLPVIRCMAGALASITRGFPVTPLFNDAGDNVAKDTASLLRAVQEVTGCRISDNRAAFEAAGYYKLYVGRNALLFDCGQLSPTYMGGHAHCDCLSFELSRDGELMFVNSGTYQYQGRLRQFFRSTAAHNTVMADRREQSELWGEHRAARRISGVRHKIGKWCVLGQFCSYHGDCFRRKIGLTEDGIRIEDCVSARDQKKHVARQFFHAAPQYCYRQDGTRQVSVWGGSSRIAVIRIPDGSSSLVHREGEICSYAQDFGRLEKKEVLEVRTPFEKRAEIGISIKFCRGTDSQDTD